MIVSDVDSYRQFLPYCIDSRVLGPTKSKKAQRKASEATNIVDAELSIGFSALRESYVSEVAMRQDEWVTVRCTVEATDTGNCKAIPSF